MHGRYQQVQPEPWPSGYGEVIALIESSPEWLSTQYGLSFFEGTDNLDDYRAAAVQLASGRRIGILRHAGAPYQGVEVHADAHDDVHDAVQELLQALELPEDVVTWMREAVVVPEPASVQVH
ncbi:MAG TPA: hypothetical protein VFT45_13115 [Longimicrobium sp.]|nr:hypothetical protein [Longimicrobium sp.]